MESSDRKFTEKNFIVNKPQIIVIKPAAAPVKRNIPSRNQPLETRKPDAYQNVGR